MEVSSTDKNHKLIGHVDWMQPVAACATDKIINRLKQSNNITSPVSMPTVEFLTMT